MCVAFDRRMIALFLSFAGLCFPFGLAAAPAPTTPARDDMIARTFPAIVRIEAIRLEASDGHMTKQWTGGSGAIISAQGHVLTNCHVAEDADYYRCYLFDGSHLDAKRIGQDAMTDLAVLQLDLSQRPKDASPLPIAKFGDSDRLAAGDGVFALGSPGFLSQSVTRGVVSNPSLVMPEQTVGKMIIRGEDVGLLVRWILHDASIFHGNSGGPLVNDRGEIVGVNEIGVFNLGGAIPGNLARGVADQLIAQGKVTRGWSGLSVQPRLESDGSRSGVVVSDVTPGSPAAREGLQPGDVVLACDGHPIEGDEEKAVSHFYRLETGRLPGNRFAVDYLRAGQRKTATLALVAREPVQTDDIELRAWGAVVRDITGQLAVDQRLPDRKGVWLENVRPAGPCGQAEPEIRRQDVIVSVNGQPVSNVDELRAITQKLFGENLSGTRVALAGVWRDGALLSSVVELRLIPEYNFPPQVRKAWLGAATQPLTPKLAARLGIKSEGGARITRLYAGTQAEAAGLRIGDIVLAIDGLPVTARRAEDTDVFARQIRQYKSGTQAVFSLWRDGQKMDLPVMLEPQPAPPGEMARWDDVPLEFTARDLAFDDRARLQLAADATGAFIESSIMAGWAYLAGLRADDLVLEADGKAIANVGDLRAAREQAVRAGHDWWRLLVQRRGRTLFVEINLKPAK
jgi:serine protease Do